VKYAFIKENKNTYTVKILCQVLQVSRRSFYGRLTRPEAARTLENRLLLKESEVIFYENKEVYGAPRIHKELLGRGFDCGLNRVARLMREAKLVPKTIKKFRVTTDSRNSKKPAENQLNRDFSTTRCNEKWVTDVTYIPTREGWLFLAAVLDLFSRRIVGWSMSNRLTNELSK